jgi:hypothetical protein
VHDDPAAGPSGQRGRRSSRADGIHGSHLVNHALHQGC